LNWALQIGPDELPKTIAKIEEKNARPGPRCAPGITLAQIQASVRTMSEVFRSTSFGDFARDENLAFIDGEGAPPPDISARTGTPMWTVYGKRCGAYKKEHKNDEGKRRIATGLTFKQARYLNWRTVNRLLALAVESQHHTATRNPTE